ncbi:MAG: ribosomal RNA small subunit methyltransferase A [Deltaproteobacteria bacterium]|jgi:16S rRNA (adenine1518-N6/adenine1519-N6)-dimethyltransferase|nr:ribosomal RNA small subunit methyltransferase A [Deltaproteobacteria bacterium]
MTDRGDHPRKLLREQGLAPRKGWGQSFLSDPRVAERIADGVAAFPEAVVLEIGAGLGALTRPLLTRARRVVALERDGTLIPILRAQLGGCDGLEVIQGDATRLDWLSLLGPTDGPRVVVGNLPYSVTGKLLSRAVHVAEGIDGAVFMVQREVGERLRAAPGGRTYGALTVFVQAAFEVESLLRVGPAAFFPRPKVDSVVLRLMPRSPPRARETASFRRVVKAAFGSRRKMLRNAWRDLGGWSAEELERFAAEAGIRLDARAETLDVEAFGRMADLLERSGRVD